MTRKEEEYRVFVGGLSDDVTKRQLEDAFSRFGKILDAQVLMERETGRPRGFGFLTYEDRDAMDDAIREMHGIEFGERAISVYRAKPRFGGGEDRGGHGYGGGGGGYASGGRGSSSSSYYGGGDRSLGQDECFKCGRPGHWARDCPSAGGGGGQFSLRHPPPRFVGGSRYGDGEGFMDDDGGRYGDRERWYDGNSSRDIKYGPRDHHYVSERYSGERFGGERHYSERYPVNRKERDDDYYYYYDRNRGDRYGGAGRGGKTYRDRPVGPTPYDRPRRRAPAGGRLSSFHDRY